MRNKHDPALDELALFKAADGLPIFVGRKSYTISAGFYRSGRNLVRGALIADAGGPDAFKLTINLVDLEVERDERGMQRSFYSPEWMGSSWPHALARIFERVSEDDFEVDLYDEITVTHVRFRRCKCDPQPYLEAAVACDACRRRFCEMHDEAKERYLASDTAARLRRER